MSKIGFIAPDKHLYLRGKSIVHELGLEDRVVMSLGRLNRAIRIAGKMQNEDVDVIVCRGGTAQLIIESKLRIPVVEISITGQDMAQVFHEAKAITGVSRPKVAMLAFKNMINEIDVISKILDIELTIYPLEQIGDIPLRISEVAASDADVIVGGMKTTHMAAHKGMKALLLRSSDFSVRTAFQEAQKIAFGRKIEKERAQEFKALVDYSGDGIITVNNRKMIKIFNPAAERLLRLQAKDAVGRRIDTILNFIDFDSCLKDGQETIGQVVQAGSLWITYNLAPITVSAQVLGAVFSFQDITRIQELEAKIRNEVLARSFAARYRFDDILGQSPQLAEAKRIAKEIASVDSTVLITGESGTGKELFAQSIHNGSRRKNGPFVAINCAALPPSLLESELFGYVEGAFTGATKKGKPGLFEMAHGGTIFLDEISEMDKYGQNRLLRVLQERQVMRLGGDKFIPVDVRVIAATNRNLADLIHGGEFRQDLYYRLKVLILNLPPLGKRDGDISFLARHFKEQFNKTHGRKTDIKDGVYQQLSRYKWPGNIRELMYFIERLVITSKNNMITVQDLIEHSEDMVQSTENSAPEFQNSAKPGTDKEMIVDALAQCGSNVSRTANLLGIDRGTLYRKLRKYHVEVRKLF